MLKHPLSLQAVAVLVSDLVLLHRFDCACSYYMQHAHITCCALQVSVVVDDARVECDAGPINFKPTVMFQTRLFNFSLKNTGLGNVDYKWAVQTLGGATDTSGTFVVVC